MLHKAAPARLPPPHPQHTPHCSQLHCCVHRTMQPEAMALQAGIVPRESNQLFPLAKRATRSSMVCGLVYMAAVCSSTLGKHRGTCT